MDNLIAEGKAEPFIIVMTYGMTNEGGRGRDRSGVAKAFETVLVDELVPYIDANFNTIAKRESRAMAPQSEGAGSAAFQIALNLVDFSKGLL